MSDAGSFNEMDDGLDAGDLADLADEGPDGSGEQPTLEQLQAEVAALKDQLLRTVADADNQRRRSEKSANDARAYAIQKFASDLLGVADNLSRALQAAPKEAADPAVKNFVLGVELTNTALQGAFERNGLKRLHPERGAKFDPHQHQAMTEFEAPDVAPGAVVQVMQDGYELFGRNIRPAMVAVASKTASAPAGQGAYAAEQPTGGRVDTSA